MSSRRALIFGVSGQDGAYLGRLLIEKGYQVSGTSRGGPGQDLPNLDRLGVLGGVAIHQLEPTDAQATSDLLAELRPDEIYYLAAQSSVWRSFEQPANTWKASALGVVTLLDAARRIVPEARILIAGSGDCFGESSDAAPVNEQSPFAPRSPYAAAKCAAHHAVHVARLASRQFACTAFLFTHESELRTEAFAIGKIVATAKRIAGGSAETLELGNVEVVRDWGWAPEYADAMWRMLQLDAPRDFVIATGRSERLALFVDAAFAAVGLDWRDHVRVDAAPPRPTDIASQHADPSLARELLGWSASTDLRSLAALLMRGGSRSPEERP